METNSKSVVISSSSLATCILTLVVLNVSLVRSIVQQSETIHDVIRRQLQQLALISSSSPTAGSVHRVRRTAVLDDNQLWNNAIIPYTFSDEIVRDASMKRAIIESFQRWESRTCIRFVDVNDTYNGPVYRDAPRIVKFVRGSVCQAAVGQTRVDSQPQTVSIAAHCAIPDMIVHELGHVIGLWHEHSRFDRDAHVSLALRNVRDEHRYNYDKLNNMRLMAPYDISSIMHYGLKTFSKNGNHVIKPLNDDHESLVGDQSEISFYDSYTVNQVYRCSEHCEVKTTLPCENRGYLNGDCLCTCPRHLAGQRCQLVKTDDVCGGIVDVHKTIYVTSPRYPSTYPDSTDCVWLLKAAANRLLVINIRNLDLEQTSNGNCKDYLEMRHHQIGIENGMRFCGRVANVSFRSITNLAILKFHSNSVRGRKGFQVAVKTVARRNCASSPCQNGARCRDITSIEMYFCNCTGRWIGQDCHIANLDGEWSAWSEWSGCRTKCGLEWRTRTCTDPEPSHGGEDCIGSRQQTRTCGHNKRVCEGVFRCSFGDDQTVNQCKVEMLERSPPSGLAANSFRWYFNVKTTPSLNTGPPGGHTTGLDNDVYVYIEASYGRPFTKTTFWLPRLVLQPGLYCLQFFYHMYGNSTGSLNLIQGINSSTTTVWRRSGCQGNSWHEATLGLLMQDGVKIGFEGMRGDSYDSDIAVDDISLSPDGCLTPDTHTTTHLQTTGCLMNGQVYSVGLFSYDVTSDDGRGCRQVNCFCNYDGFADCPDWDVQDATACRRRKATRQLQQQQQQQQQAAAPPFEEVKTSRASVSRSRTKTATRRRSKSPSISGVLASTTLTTVRSTHDHSELHHKQAE